MTGMRRMHACCMPYPVTMRAEASPSYDSSPTDRKPPVPTRKGKRAMTVSKSPNPRIILQLRDGLIYAEAPGLNGARQKLGPFSIADLPSEVANNLLDQRDAIRAREAEALRQLQLENVRAVVHKHGLPLAKQVWHNSELVFSRSLKRPLSATNLGTTASPSTTTAKPKPNRGQIINIDLSTELD